MRCFLGALFTRTAELVDPELEHDLPDVAAESRLPMMSISQLAKLFLERFPALDFFEEDYRGELSEEGL